MTRARLVQAAEKLFIRKGFDDTSVEEISEAAGYSRGAFYSNFEGKDQVFLALIHRRRMDALEVLDAAFPQTSECASRTVREWFSNQWRRKDMIALQMEFSRRAMKDRSVRKHLNDLCHHEVDILAAAVCRHVGVTGALSPDRPEIVALVLMAVSQGLGILALDSGSEWDQMYTDAAKLAFDRMTVLQLSQ